MEFMIPSQCLFPWPAQQFPDKVACVNKTKVLLVLWGLKAVEELGYWQNEAPLAGHAQGQGCSTVHLIENVKAFQRAPEFCIGGWTLAGREENSPLKPVLKLHLQNKSLVLPRTYVYLQYKKL